MIIIAGLLILSELGLNIVIAYGEDGHQVIHAIKEIGVELARDTDYAVRILDNLEIFGLDPFGETSLGKLAIIRQEHLAEAR